MEIKVLKDILGANEQIAQRNRKLLDSKGIFAVNIMSSPGAGKTSLIRETIKRLKGKVKVGVIEGDVSSTYDADIIAKENVPVLQINTGGGCHLDANMVQSALENLPLDEIELLLIENVGNLICPAEFTIGEHKRVVVSSIPEGDDKPLKYPLIFHETDIVLLNKIDLRPYLSFKIPVFSSAVKRTNSKVQIMPVSCVTDEGIDQWVSWLMEQMEEKKVKRARARTQK